MTFIPTGAAVREIGTKRLGRCVASCSKTKPRGWLTVRFDGEKEDRDIHCRDVDYVSQLYGTAKQWEAAKAAVAEFVAKPPLPPSVEDIQHVTDSDGVPRRLSAAVRCF
jgi:hypothetical protein